jgi:hypothetical protein
MRIALDYDGTYTADPQLWDEFIRNAQSRGHEVTLVTMRSSDHEHIPNPPACAVIYTGRKSKRNFYNADIVIDDAPQAWFQDFQ